MKKTKQKTKKKITTKSAFIYGLIGGFSIFAIFLLIVILIGYANIPKTQSVNGNNQSYNYSMEVQRALPPPTSYDYAVMPLWSEDLDGFAWGSSYYYDTQEGKLDDYIHFDFISATDTYVSDTILFQEQVGEVSATMSFQLPTSEFNYSYANDDYYAGLGAIGSDDINASSLRWSIIFQNTSTHDYKLIFDVSSSGVNSTYFLYVYESIGSSTTYIRSTPTFSFTTLYYNEVILTAKSKIIVFTPTTANQRFLDAFYIKDLGFNSAYVAGYEQGEVDYDLGYTDGWADGHQNGIDTANSMSNGVNDAFDLIYKGAQSIDKILSINIFGSITLGMLLFTPLIVGSALSVVKIIKG